MNHPLYTVAVCADDAFSDQLVRVFGVKRAADMRYQPNRWPQDFALLASARVKQDADRAWLQAMRGAA